MIRVWFNHWFSTSYQLIELMKEDKEEEIYIIGSNQQIHSVIQKVCDEWYEDPITDGEEYLAYCIEFCKSHKIDVFVPRRKMLEISEHIALFHAIGTKVMVDDFSIIQQLNHKAAAYEYFHDCKEIYIPAYRIVNNAKQFVKAYQELRESYDQICMKFVKDEGGRSFRKITEHVDQFHKLRVYPGTEISYEVLLKALQEERTFDDLMLMPYLPGYEISVDCLNTETGLIAIPRKKGSARHEKIEYQPEILQMTKCIMEKTALKYPCNIQFKVKDEIPYLLEINTRMSGGLPMSCFASGINIPNIALNKLLNKTILWEEKKEEKIVSYIEVPQIIR